jgi:hypothetical protein
VYRAAISALLCLGWTASARGVEHVVFRQDGKEMQVEGRLEVEAQDGGIVVLARDGFLWAIPPEQQIKHTRDEVPFKPLGADEMAKRLLAELPAGFESYQTTHYLILHDTSRVYAQWCGSLFERLYMAFTNFWTRRGFTLKEPEFPLVAIVFAERPAYLKYARPELGAAGESIIGYFSLRSNRMTMYDLTGAEANRQKGHAGSAGGINQILSRPDALRTVSTIVHEATHQIAFNCGLHVRYSDCPVWFSEGIAIYFETPDLSSAKGWKGVGTLNQARLGQFHDYVRSRPSDSLKTLLGGDARFRDTKQALDAYAEAWALTYYLMQHYPKQYVAYLKMLSEKKPLLEDGPEGRLKQFQQVFGDLKQLDGEFMRYMGRLR